jgi:drug/metabolite transporter (DMT)-like permease
MIIGTLPVVIAITANLRNARAGQRQEGRLPWARLAPSLGLIGLGIGLVNHTELGHLRADPNADVARYALGAVLALGAVACWTWYPLRNADWLRAHADRHPRSWATAQGLMTLPLAALGFAGTWAWFSATDAPWAMPLGPRPGLYLGLMLAIGLFSSWVGTLCWNEASQRLPTTLVGQLIVFETLSALAYAYVWRQTWPEAFTLAGVALLVAGVMWALRVKPVPAPEAEPAH